MLFILTMLCSPDLVCSPEILNGGSSIWTFLAWAVAGVLTAQFLITVYNAIGHWRLFK